MYDLYKRQQTRTMPEDLRQQIPLYPRRANARLLNLACLELENYEAEDIIATLASQGRASAPAPNRRVTHLGQLLYLTRI